MKSIVLDGKMSSLLDFRQARLAALSHIAIGEKILWELDLGLFDTLTHPFGNESEARSMILAIDHFMKSMWPEFEKYSVGLSLYRGDLNFDEILFSDFLKFLTLNVYDSVPLFLHFDTATPHTLESAKKFAQDLFPRFEIYVNDQEPPFKSRDTNIGFLIPSDHTQKFETLLNQGINLRVIPESLLNAEWDGLDFLYVDYALVSKEGIRKIRGFEAAGGEVIDLGLPLANVI